MNIYVFELCSELAALEMKAFQIHGAAWISLDFYIRRVYPSPLRSVEQLEMAGGVRAGA